VLGLVLAVVLGLIPEVLGGGSINILVLGVLGIVDGLLDVLEFRRLPVLYLDCSILLQLLDGNVALFGALVVIQIGVADAIFAQRKCAHFL